MYACLNFQENPNGKLSILVVMLLGTKLDSNQYLLPRSNITYLKSWTKKVFLEMSFWTTGLKIDFHFLKKPLFIIK